VPCSEPSLLATGSCDSSGAQPAADGTAQPDGYTPVGSVHAKPWGRPQAGEQERHIHSTKHLHLTFDEYTMFSER
jgi:hypothetical protein